MSNQQEELIAIAAEGMGVFRAEMETIDRISQKIGNKTSRIIGVVFVLLTIISIYLVILTFNMGRDLSLMIGSLDDMYAEFGSMSSEMRQMSTHVESMGLNVQGMPAIAANMQHLNSDVGAMLASVENMNRDMGAMNTNIGLVANGTSEMTFRFGNVQRAMSIMQRDVHQMLRPMNMIPR